MASRTSTRVLTGQFLLGAVVILIGVLLLLDTTDLLPTRALLPYVPALFVLVGIWALVGSGFRNVFGPTLLIGVASAWQLVALDYATVDEVLALWPVLVIALGLSILLGQVRSRSRGRSTDDAFTSAFTAFGGTERRNTSQSFRGADLTALFGGTELDLRDAAIEDRPARINAVALFGGVDVVVPREWSVRMDVLPVLGGASDERPRRESEREGVDLLVTGFAAFGGVSVSD